MNWYGCLPKMVDDIDSPSPVDKRSMRNLTWFQAALVKATVLVDGFVTVAVIPRELNEGADKTATPDEQQEDRNGRESDEDIVGVALWLPPGKTLDMGPITMLRSGIFKVLFGWGLTGVKVWSLFLRSSAALTPAVLLSQRVLFDFSPAVEHSLEKSFKARGLDRLDSWHLLEMVVDPAHQKQGLPTFLPRLSGVRETDIPWQGTQPCCCRKASSAPPPSRFISRPQRPARATSTPTSASRRVPA